MLCRDGRDDFLGFNSDWKEFHAIREMKYREYEDEREHNEERVSFPPQLGEGFIEVGNP